MLVARLRARRADGKESLAIVASMPSSLARSHSRGQSTLPKLEQTPSALSIAASAWARFASDPALSKDLLLVVPKRKQLLPCTCVAADELASPGDCQCREPSALGLWVEDRSGSTASAVDSGWWRVAGGSTSLVAAMALETPSDGTCFDKLTVIPFGSLGTLPNLDVVSSAMAAFDMPVSVAEATLVETPSTQPHGTLLSAWQRMGPLLSSSASPSYATGLARFALAQALSSAASSGAHAPFVGRGIDAITLAGVIDRPSSAVCDGGHSARRVARGIVQWVRMFVNSHERLHHSTWLYLLGDSSSFASFGRFFPALVLLLAPLSVRVICGLGSWGWGAICSAGIAFSMAATPWVLVASGPTLLIRFGIWTPLSLSMWLVAAALALFPLTRNVLGPASTQADADMEKTRSAGCPLFSSSLVFLPQHVPSSTRSSPPGHLWLWLATSLVLHVLVVMNPPLAVLFATLLYPILAATSLPAANFRLAGLVRFVVVVVCSPPFAAWVLSSWSSMLGVPAAVMPSCLEALGTPTGPAFRQSASAATCALIRGLPQALTSPVAFGITFLYIPIYATAVFQVFRDVRRHLARCVAG